MSMAGAFGDRWAIRTHPSGAAAADAAGEVAATKAAVPPSNVVTATSRAQCLRSFIGKYLLSDQCLTGGKRASGRGRAGCRGPGRRLWIDGQDRGEQPQRARRGELD